MIGANPAKVLFTLFSLLPALAAHQAPRHGHAQQAKRYAGAYDYLNEDDRIEVVREPQGLEKRGEIPQQLDERLLPITATTVVVVQMTKTETIWVAPTGQAPFVPSAVEPSTTTESSASSAAIESLSSGSASSVTPVDTTTLWTHSPSTSTAPSPSANAEEASSISASSIPVLTTGGALAPPPSSISVAAESSGSNAPYPSRASGSGEPRPSPAASSSIAESNAPPPYVGSSGSGEPRPQPTTVASSSTSNAPIPSRASSGSGEPRPRPTSASSSRSTSNAPYPYSRTSGSGEPRPRPTSAAESSSTSAPASSSITDWAVSSSLSSSAIISSVIASSSAESSWSSSAVASSTSSATPQETAGSNGVPRTIMAAYYPDWSAWSLPPESLDWSKFDVVDFAFAIPTADNNLQFTQDDSSDLLKRLVSTGHAAGKKVKLSIGGWTGSAYFSTICADWQSRQTFVANIRQAYYTYNLDGIDIDWEYPNAPGAAGNAISKDDSANYLSLLQDLRAALPSGALITTATQVFPFADENGSALRDVSAFAKVLDWILIMNYDIWGSDNTAPGPNAPLSDACGNSTQPLANAYAAIQSWTSAGMPADKITLGIPAYGYLQESRATSLKQRKRGHSNFQEPPHKRAADMEKRYVSVKNDWGATSGGQIQFANLIKQGALTPNSRGGFEGAGGFWRNWDGCSSTPWLKSDASGQIITYDDTDSISLKAQFAAQAGLRGCNIFSVDGDYVNGGFPLTDAARSGLGL